MIPEGFIETQYKGYFINNKGDIYSTKVNRVLKTTEKRGYLAVNLSIQGKTITKSIHRLVALAFVPNPNNYPCVNHIDENKKNNSADNLEWCSVAYNNAYNGRIQRIASKRCKPVVQYDKKGNKIREYRSAVETERYGFDRKFVGAVCRGSRNSCYGFIFKFKGGDADVKP